MTSRPRRSSASTVSKPKPIASISRFVRTAPLGHRSRSASIVSVQYRRRSRFVRFAAVLADIGSGNDHAIRTSLADRRGRGYSRLHFRG